MLKEIKDKIDAMSYKDMLTMHRFAAMGHPYFFGEVGTYFAEKMQEKKDALESGECVHISKEIGWR